MYSDATKPLPATCYVERLHSTSSSDRFRTVSIRETAMVEAYWRRVGGTLVEEYPLTKYELDVGRRRADAVILLDGPKEQLRPQTPIPLDGREVVVVQAKTGRLGMYLLGQAFFSKLLCERRGAASVRSVALCERDDAELRPLFEQYDNCEVVVLARSEYEYQDE